jgi:hypothetical protein
VQRFTILRLKKDYFAVVSLGLLSTDTLRPSWTSPSGEAYNTDLILVCDWNGGVKNIDDIAETRAFQPGGPKSRFVETKLQKLFISGLRQWEIAMVLEAGGKFDQAEEERKAAKHLFQSVAGEEHIHSTDCLCNQLPVHWVAKTGNHTVLRVRLARGRTDLNKKDPRGETPLAVAAKMGHVAMVRLLLLTGQTDINSRNSIGCTPLHLAAHEGHKEITRMLIENDCTEINFKDQWNRWAVTLAAANGHNA